MTRRQIPESEIVSRLEELLDLLYSVSYARDGGANAPEVLGESRAKVRHLLADLTGKEWYEVVRAAEARRKEKASC